MSSPLIETAEYLRGKRAEVFVDGLLRRIAPTCLIENTSELGEKGSAGLADRGATKIVLPDRRVSWRGKSHYLEVKRKSDVRYSRIDRVWQHGIDERRYIDYCRTEIETGVEVRLVFCCDTTRRILISRQPLRTMPRVFGAKFRRPWSLGTPSRDLVLFSVHDLYVLYGPGRGFVGEDLWGDTAPRAKCPSVDGRRCEICDGEK